MRIPLAMSFIACKEEQWGRPKQTAAISQLEEQFQCDYTQTCSWRGFSWRQMDNNHHITISLPNPERRFKYKPRTNQPTTLEPI